MTVQDSLALVDFVSTLIGKPYVNGGRGPHEFDCWGLVSHFYKERLGIELKQFAGFDANDTLLCSRAFENAAQSKRWIQLEEPEAGCVVAMSKSNRLHHVGVWLEIDGGLCLHALDGSQVVAHNLHRLKQEHFSKILFFRYDKNL